MKKYFAFLALSVGMLVVVFLPASKAFAAPFNRSEFVGYFNKNEDVAHKGHNIFPSPGVNNVNKIDDFVNTYRDALNSGNDQKEVGASFTILTMLGYPAGTDWNTAWTEFPKWEQTVRNYNTMGWIQWNVNYPYSYNTLYFTEPSTAGDVAWYNNVDQRNSIVFYNPDGGTYAIKKDCANPVGDMTPLEQVPPTTVKCGTMAFTPSRPEPGDNMTVTVTVTYTGGFPPPKPAKESIQISGVGDVGMARESLSSTVSGGTYTLYSNAFRPPTTGRYSVSWSMTVNGVSPTPGPTCGGTFTLGGDSFDVMTYPYFDVKGGDVAAGAGFATSTGRSCGTSNARAGIVGWNKDGDPTYAGAGGQFGVSAFSFIQDFLSNQGNPNGAGFTSLSFAGVNVDPSGGKYGGFFGKGPCVNYWARNPGPGRDFPTPGPQSLNNLSGTYYHSGDVTINPSNLTNGEHLTIYVDGNVAIKGDIKYGGSDNPTWSSLADIPSFKLIVHGTIYIGSNVGKLDGNYVAVPDDGYYNSSFRNSISAPAPGTVSTCSRDFSVTNPADGRGNVNQCDNPLVINGSLAANTIYFLRTSGTMSGPAAEQINYDPEVWLSPDDKGTVDPAYQSIIGLPPVL